MSQTNNISVFELNQRLKTGDKRQIAELCNLSYTHVVNVLNGKRKGKESVDIIIKVAYMLLENRASLKKQINVKPKI